MIPGQRSIGSKRIPDNQCDHLGSYSFMWWINGVDRNAQKLLPDAPDDTFMASGHGSKRAVVVIPSLDLIVSWNDTNISGAQYDGLIIHQPRRAPGFHTTLPPP